MEICALTQSSQGPSPRSLIGLALAHDLLQARAQHGADRSSVLGSKNLGFAQQFRIEFKGDVGFHQKHESACSTRIRANYKPSYRCSSILHSSW